MGGTGAGNAVWNRPSSRELLRKVGADPTQVCCIRHTGAELRWARAGHGGGRNEGRPGQNTAE